MNYELGKKIRLLRLSKNMTQEQLAEKLGIAPQSVSKWENNITAPDIQLLPELSVIFGVTIDELFSITNESKLERIENLFCNASEITVLSDKDFETYKDFLNENLENAKIKERVTSALANLYVLQSKTYKNTAIEYAIKAVEDYPDNKFNHSILTYALDGQKREWYINSKCKVIDFYIYFIKNNPNNVYAYRTLIDNLIAENRIKDAEKYLSDYAKIENTCRIHYYKAQIYYSKGEYESFEQCVEQMLHIFKDNWLCWSLCGDLYAYAEMYGKAVECFKQAFDLQPSPKYTDNLLSIAKIYEITGDFEKASKYYEKTIELLKQEWNTTDGDLIDAYRYMISDYQTR